MDVAVQTISNWTDDFSKTSESEELEKWHGFEPPIYNVWCGLRIAYQSGIAYQSAYRVRTGARTDGIRHYSRNVYRHRRLPVSGKRWFSEHSENSRPECRILAGICPSTRPENYVMDVYGNQNPVRVIPNQMVGRILDTEKPSQNNTLRCLTALQRR